MGSGPLPTDQYWEHIISSTAGGVETEDIITLTSRTLSFNERAYIPNGVPLVPSVTSAIPHAAQGTLTIRLRTTSTILEQTSRPIVIDWQTGYAQINALRASAPAGGGFIEADRQELAQTKALAAMNLGLWGPALEAALQSLSQFPYGAELITPDRTGGGVLSRPGGGFNVNALGIYFEVISKPPGIGVDEGAPPSYEMPALELGLISQIAGGTDVNKDSHWFSDANGLWIWNFDVPFQVVYWIQPGVTVRFYWLLFNPLLEDLVGPAELLDQLPAAGMSQ